MVSSSMSSLMGLFSMRSQRGAGEHAVAGAGVDVLRAADLHQGFRRVAEAAGGVHHVVEQYHVLAGDVADDVHDLGGIGLLPALIDDGQGHVQLLRKGTRAGHAAHVRRDDHESSLPRPSWRR